VKAYLDKGLLKTQRKQRYTRKAWEKAFFLTQAYVYSTREYIVWFMSYYEVYGESVIVAVTIMHHHHS